jgi:glycosyltransferase involved in cell wall biosynthesis
VIATASATIAPPAPAISVIICAYTTDRWLDLLAAVDSIRKQTRPALEVIVAVDHDSALAGRARELRPPVLVTENRGTRGLSDTRNAGIALARGDVIAFLDDDAFAAPEWLERLAAGYTRPEVLGVGGAVEPRWAGGRPRGFPTEFDWVVGCTYRGLPTSTEPVRNLIGANMSFRREVFDGTLTFRAGIGRVGAQPEGCEETELCIRARRGRPGAVLLYDPSARVAHRVPRQRAGWRYFRARCFAEGVSKARVAAAAGRRDGLASERSYARRTLPAGVGHGLRDLLGGDVTGALRAAGIVAGLAMTTLGFVVGTLRVRRATRRRSPLPAPVPLEG